MAIARLTIDLAVGLAGFESDMGRAARITKRQTAQMERQVTQFAKRAGKVLGTGLVAGFVAATKAAADFEKAMAEVSTLVDDTSGMDSLTDSVKALSLEFGKAPTEQAEALYQIISSGAEAGAEAVDILTVSNKLAVGGITDLRTAADGLTTVMNVYGNRAGDATAISDKLFAAMKAGKTTIGELSGGIGQAIGTAEALGVSFDELVAAGSTLASTGITTKQAFTNLRQVFANILEPQGKAAELAKDLGLNFGGAALEGRTFAQLLRDVQSATKGNIDQMAQLFGSVESLEQAFKLTGSASEQFESTLNSVKNSAGETNKAVEKVLTTVSTAFDRLKSAISVELIETGDVDGLADAINSVADNVDLLFNSIKALAALMAGAFVGNILASVGALKTMIATIGVGKIAIAGMLGAVGALALAAGTVVTAYRQIQEIMRESSQDIVRTNTLLLAQADALRETGNAMQLVDFRADLVTRTVEITNQINELQAALNLARERYDAFNAAGVATPKFLAEQSAHIEELELALRNARQVLDAYAIELGETNAATESATRAAKEFADSLEEVRVTGKKRNFLKEFMAEADAKMTALWKTVEQTIDSFDEFLATEEQMRSLVDSLDPVGAAMRRAAEAAQFAADNAQLLTKYGIDLEDALALIDAQARETVLGLLGLKDQSKDTADAIVSDADRMREATLEGVRQMTAAFGDMWADIISGAENSFDGIQDAFSGMISNLIRSATTDKIQLQFEGAFGEGGGGFGSLDFGELGKSFGAIAAAEFSDDIVQGLFGDASTADYVAIGKQIGTVVGAVIGTIFFGQTALGAALGSFVGALDGLIFGKIFGRKFFGDIAGAVAGREANPRDDAQTFATALGEIVGISGRGGFGDFDDPESPAGAIKEAITVFDQAIFDVLAAVDATDELNSIISDLEAWRVQVADTGTAIEDIIQSRFDTVLQTFAGDISDFVSSVEGFEEQLTRLSIGISAQKLFDDVPDLFGDSSLGDFLALVESSNGAFEELAETFNNLVTKLFEIKALTDFLGEFSASDLESEFDALVALQGRSIKDSLAAVNNELFDAITNFDGSIEGLQEIAGLVATVREGEIRYLTELNALQKGLNANLDDLRAEILGLTAPPQTAQDLISEAGNLIADIANATGTDQIADIERQFSAIIRSINPDDAAFRQIDIVSLIDRFQAAANTAIEGLRSDALENGQNARDAIGDFVERVGAPLDILVASNERAAAALEILAGTPESGVFTPPDQIAISTGPNFGGGESAQRVESDRALAADLRSIQREGHDNLAAIMAANNSSLVSAMVFSLQRARFQVIVPTNTGFVNN